MRMGERMVEAMMPPISSIAMLDLISELEPEEMASGSIPTTMVIEVIIIGRNRVMPDSRRASLRLMPRLTRVLA